MLADPVSNATRTLRLSPRQRPTNYRRPGDFTAVPVAMGIIQTPTNGWSNSYNRHTWDFLNQLRTLVATHLLYISDVMQLYSKEFLFLEDTTDLDDEIQNMLRPTLDEEPPSPGTVMPVSSWMLYSTIRLFAIAFERPFI
jgi:hypothetical protein